MKRTKHHPHLIVPMDVGNSTLAFRIYGQERILSSRIFPTHQIPDGTLFARSLRGQLEGASFVICSVVPKMTRALVSKIKKEVVHPKILVVGEDIRLQVPVRYKTGQLGMDRLVNVCGAQMIYRLPVLVVDFGTAITFDYMSKKGVFEGGLIVPGIEMSARALMERAALIPDLGPLKPVRSWIGHDTRSALFSGTLNGFGFLADGLIRQFRRKAGRSLTVIGTGGYAAQIWPFVRELDCIDPYHTLKSLVIIYQNIQRNR